MQQTYLGRLGAGVEAGAWAGLAAGCAESWLRGTLPIRYQMPMLFSSLGNQTQHHCQGCTPARASGTDVCHKHLGQ